MRRGAERKSNRSGISGHGTVPTEEMTRSYRKQSLVEVVT
jgi:hypothetical protein